MRGFFQHDKLCQVSTGCPTTVALTVGCSEHWINGNLAWKIHVEPGKFWNFMYFVHGNPARKSFHETKSMLNVVMYDSALRHCGSSLNHLSLHHLWIAIRLRHVVSIDNTRCGRAGPVFFKARFESRTATSGGYFVTYEGWCDQHSGAGFCPPPLCCCWWIMDPCKS